MSKATQVEAGPALDAEIERRVFGRLVEMDPDGPRSIKPGSSAYLGKRVPRYSTDWSAAGLVVERMKQDGWSFGFWETHDLSSVQQYPIAAFTRSVYPPHPIHPKCGLREGMIGSYGETMPEAICRAALAALDAREGEG